MTTRGFLAILTGLLALTALSCSGGGAPQAEPPAPAEAPAAGDAGPRPARTLPLPVPGAAAGEEPPGAGGGRLAWKVPDGWTSEQPSSSMRLAQYRVPGPGGDGTCVVFYFGPGQGGDPASNAVRWAEQFAQPDGRSSVDLMQVTPLEGTAVPVQIVEVTGTYDGGMTMTDAPAEPAEHHMLLGGIAMGADAPWFFKFTGPEETVRGQRQAFLDMMTSIRPGS
jgi:hypothetical protein